MYDTHCHLNFKAFENDYNQIIQNALKQGMFLNVVGSQYETSKRAVEIAHEFENDPVYAIVGLHPIHVEGNDDIYTWNYENYKKLALDPKVVAIGETGIDYYRVPTNAKSWVRTSCPHPKNALRVKKVRTRNPHPTAPDKQKQIFIEHINLALALKKPLIIHCRPSKGSFDAYFDLIDITTSYKLQATSCKGVVHCFLADWQIAQDLLELGLYISFTGIITYKNIDDYLIDAIKHIPLNRIMIETDAPYLTPEPYRGKKRNEPLYVKLTAQRIAEIKGIDVKEVIQAAMENGKKLFLPSSTLS